MRIGLQRDVYLAGQGSQSFGETTIRNWKDSEIRPVTGSISFAKNTYSLMEERRTIKMILTTILILMLAVLTVIVVCTVAAGGVAFIVVFGDVIVCIFLLVMLIKWLFKKDKKDKK